MSESLRERLRRLRRESARPPGGTSRTAPAAHDGPAAAGETAGTAGTVGPGGPGGPGGAGGAGEEHGELGSVRDRLARRRQRPRATAANAVERVQTGATGATTVGPPRGLASEGPVVARATHCASSDAHGAWTMDEVDAADPATFELLTGDAALAGLDLRDVVYLDTETSGLSGGAGTWVFLVGLGRFVDDGKRFEVWQGFLAGPEAEHALLAETAERIRDAAAVVSFFGKSFDRHRLEDKMRLVGVEPPFDGRPHLDLFHPLRRLYGGAFEDTRLATLERELCGFERTDDLSGAFAPAAWFDFLAGRPHRLEGVFEHNLHDVRSLVALAAHLGRSAHETRGDGGELPGPAAERAAGLARSLWKRGRRAEALRWVERARERRDSRELRLLRADALRLTRACDAALAAYAELVEESEDAATARCWIELAKLHEHARGDLGAALECCRRSRAALERRLTGPARGRLVRELERREARLAARAAR